MSYCISIVVLDSYLINIVFSIGCMATHGWPLEFMLCVEIQPAISSTGR